MIRRKTALLAALLSLGGAGALWAADPVEQHNSNALWFENWTGLSNATLKVTAPDGAVTELFAASGTPVFQLSGRDILDGIYRYEMSAATDKTAKLVNKVDNGRGEAQRDSAAVPYHLSGHFTVSRGVIIRPEEIKED